VVKNRGKPLSQEHGGPVRMITPQFYAWKGAKWIKRIQFITEDRPGF
jgi:DMSO/TMAO reductase YedYZ molybdopterin-dependent catalytic subunit